MAGAADDEDDSDFNVATWRIVLFFLAILFVDTAWEYIDHIITKKIRLRKSKGLLHAWEQLKFEVMALGLVSLLLVVFEVCSLNCRAHATLRTPCVVPAGVCVLELALGAAAAPQSQTTAAQRCAPWARSSRPTPSTHTGTASGTCVGSRCASHRQPRMSSDRSSATRRTPL